MQGRLVRPEYVLAFILMLAASIAVAQNVPFRVRGEITSVDGQLVRVQTREGTTERIQLALGASILSVVPAELSGIVPGAFVGVAAIPRPDGRLTALEVLVFPESMRGTGEGQYPWDLRPESTMTNATIFSTEAEANDRVLSLRYPEGEATVVVPPEAAVVTFETGDVSLLQAGNHVFIPGAARQPDGTLLVQMVAVGKDGLVPPM